MSTEESESTIGGLEDLIHENREWIESLDYVYENQGPERVHELLRLLQNPRPGARRGVSIFSQHPLYQHHFSRPATGLSR